MIKEACVESLEEALLAEKRGADRIELCSDLANDGLTPSFNLMKETCSRLNIPVMVMIRPRAGGFVYSNEEISEMEKQIEQAKQTGASGVVFGLLTANNEVDKKNTGLLASLAYPLPVTFHKAIDELDDPTNGVKDLLEIKNIKRILTSGGKPTALEGLKKIKEMMKTANNKIVILVAGKVLSSNLEELQKSTEAKEFHGRKIVGNLGS